MARSQDGQTTTTSTYITIIKDNITFPTTLLVNFGNSSPVPQSLGARITLIITAYDISNFDVIWRVFICDLKKRSLLSSIIIERKDCVGLGPRFLLACRWQC